MKILSNFYTDFENDILVIIKELQNIKNGFFVANNFYPISEKIYTANSVIFPEMNKDDFKNICLIELSKEENKDFLKDKLKRDSNEISLQKFEQIETEWKIIQDRFFDYFSEIFDVSLQTIVLNIYYSSYGRISFSEAFKDKLDNFEFNIFIRQDAGIYEIAREIIRGYCFDILKSNNISWSEQISLVDAFFKFTKLKRLFPEAYSFKEKFVKNHEDINLIEASMKFLEKINYECIKNKFRVLIENNHEFLDGKRLAYKFTDTELKVLQVLLKKQSSLCTYSDIGKTLWRTSRKYSIWAISRLIYKIRKKLILNDLSHYKLQTIRGKGFILDA
jgi:DNA-binding winged helix-turn-helix (wHTH) protein